MTLMRPASLDALRGGLRSNYQRARRAAVWVPWRLCWLFCDAEAPTTSAVAQALAVTHNPLAIDVAAAVAIAAVVLIVDPGVAIAAILALLVLLVCVASLLLDRRRARRALRTRWRRR